MSSACKIVDALFAVVDSYLDLFRAAFSNVVFNVSHVSQIKVGVHVS